MFYMINIFLFFDAGKFVSNSIIPTKNVTLSSDAHLKIEHIKKVCSNSVAICKSNDSNICATRLINGKMDFLDFENTCFLFIKNMCEHYGNDTKTKQILRNHLKSTLYEVDTAFDFHTCPLSCPNVYSPVCIGANRGHGLYYKFFTFVNHCEGDLYYCKHWREFSPPPDEDELIRSSPLSWSFCAANRYIQFARFTEMTSAMGHYGWLAGDHRPTHIMEPHQRVPGFG